MKDTLITVFKDLFKTNDVPYVVPLEKVLHRIKVGKSKDLIAQIRNGEKKLKNKLPAILFSGEFEKRELNGLKKHSGLICLDYDKFENDELLKKEWDILINNKHVVCCFISPSGNGIKAVVRIPESDKKTHYQIFHEFNNVFPSKYFDTQCSDISRVCFESYDPNMYINYDAELFNPKIKDEGYRVTDKTPLLPVNDEGVIIDKIMAFSWKKDFVEGERNNFVFDLAGMFCEYGVSETTAEGYLFNNVCLFNKEYTEREAVNAIKSAYKRRSFGSKYFEDYDKQKAIKTDLNKGKKSVIEKYKIDDATFDQIKEELTVKDFWYYEEDSKGNVKIKVDPLNYKLFLENNGFKKYFPEGSQKPTWVKIKSNIVSETSVEKIKDYVLDWLMDNKKLDIWSYCASYQNLFSDSFLLMLESIELLMLKDTKHSSFIAYQNGILTITKDYIELKDYIDVDGYVWESQIIKRDFKPVKDYLNEYQTFVNNISNNEPLPIETTIGYLLCNYKNKMNNKAVILNDEVISNAPEGGTGKGLFVQGLKQIRRTSILDGKTFDDKKSFPYQTVSQDTNILVFDDVKKNWDFESKFSLVTEGITLERKNKDAIKLTVEDSPKMVVSTNYAIKGEGNSHDRRRHEIEIAQYYGKELTPYDEFKRQLFDDWNLEEFNKFDNYMVYCIQAYLKNGLIKQNAVNIKLRKFIAETSMEFYEWINESANFPRNVRNDKSIYFDNFVNEYQDFKKWLSRRKFAEWVEKYANFKNLKYYSGVSNGLRWYEISDPNETTPEDEIEF
jgi:hypothetical protein